MNTKDIYSKNDLVLFHITGGGGNKQQLTSEGFGKITDCSEWNNQFANEDGLYDCDGNELMDARELNDAYLFGIGRLEIDGYYNTYYTSKLSELSNEEFRALDAGDELIYLVVVKGYDEDVINEFELDYFDLYENGFPKQIDVDKEDYSVIQMIGGQYKIAKGWNSNPVYGGDSACEDNYDKELMDSIYNNWDGELFWNEKRFNINL